VIEARKGEPGGRELDSLIQKAEIVVVAVDAEQVSEARRAYPVSARAATPLDSISEMFSRTRWPAPRASRSSSKAMIFPRQTSVE
jgi:hypothetical protein